VNTSDKPKLAFADILDKAKPAERTVRLCLRGDLVGEFEDFERQLGQARAREADSLAGTGARRIAEAMEALREQMDEQSVTFRLRTLPRRPYQDLVKAHPPRRDDAGNILKEDAGYEINAETFWFALARACLVEPEMTDEQYTHLVDDILSDRQFEQLAITAYNLCRGSVDIPFSLAASELTRISGGALSAPNGSASPSAVSTAGSPQPSTSMTTMTG
jgi:hypothetical protein